MITFVTGHLGVVSACTSLLLASHSPCCRRVPANQNAMLLPLFGFVFGVVSSASLGAVVLALHPRWKLTLRNTSFFVGGSFAAAISSMVLYTWLFADENQHLQSAAFGLGFLATLCMATLLGGIAGTLLGRRFFPPAEEAPSVKAD